MTGSSGVTVALVGLDVGLSANDTRNQKHRNLWLADSGASCHMTFDETGMFDCRDIRSQIKIGNSQTMTAIKIGKKRVHVVNQDGSVMEFVLEECKLIPDLWVNLFSLTKSMSKGWQISNKGLNFVLSEDKYSIMFDHVIKTANGHVTGIELISVPNVAQVHIEKGSVLDVNDFHKSMGHIYKGALDKTAAYYGVKLRGKLEPCYECSLAKIRQVNVGKEAKSKSTVPGERLFVDISSVSTVSFGGAKFWVLVVDDCTDKCWSFFVKAKSQMPDKVVLLIKKLRSDQRYPIRHVVKTIRCDDAGENKVLETLCIKEQLGIHFEYTGPGTPQYNGRVERKFATLYGRVRTMLNAAKLTKDLRRGVWAECAKMASDIEDMVVTTSKPVAAFNQFYGIKEPKLKIMKQFGEMAVVENHDRRKIRSKLENRGKPCMFLGVAPNHAPDVFRFLNLATNKVIVSRNVIWLGKCYGDWQKLTPSEIEYVADDEIEDSEIEDLDQGRAEETDGGMDEVEVEEETEEDTEIEVEPDPELQPVVEPPPPVQPRMTREMRRLEGFYNPTATAYMNQV
jgi:hypothetical protein